MTTPPATPSENPAEGVGPPAPVEVSIGEAEIVAVLERMSKRGRLPGFEKGREGELFSVAAHGRPFDKRLIASACGSAGGTRLEWRVALEKKLPWVFAVSLALSVWPGWPVTDSLLVTYFPGSYGEWTSGWFKTWMWYLPLSIGSVPFVWRTVMRQTNSSAGASAREAAAKIEAELKAG